MRAAQVTDHRLHLGAYPPRMRLRRVRAVSQAIKPLVPITRHPPVHSLAGHPEPLGDLGYRDAIKDFQHGPISLLDHVQLPKHCGSVAHQVKPRCRISSGAGHVPVSWAVTTFFTGFKGAPSARQPDRPRPRLTKDARDEHGERERGGQCRCGGQGCWGPSPQVAGSLARFLLRDSAPSRAAARRADAPHPAAARTRRNAPWVMRSASWPGRSSRTGCADRRMKGHSAGPERRALSGSAPPASTVLRIPLRGTRLRRAVDPGDLGRPSGPDGEGQARGQAL